MKFSRIEEAKISSSLTFQYLFVKKNRRKWKIEKLIARNNVEKLLEEKHNKAQFFNLPFFPVFFPSKYWKLNELDIFASGEFHE